MYILFIIRIEDLRDGHIASLPPPMLLNIESRMVIIVSTRSRISIQTHVFCALEPYQTTSYSNIRCPNKISKWIRHVYLNYVGVIQSKFHILWLLMIVYIRGNIFFCSVKYFRASSVSVVFGACDVATLVGRWKSMHGTSFHSLRLCRSNKSTQRVKSILTL